MPALRELQARFAGALFMDDTQLLGWVRGNGLDPARRLAVYRNNTEAGLTEALRETFPVLCRLVGEDFFAATARAFLRRHPPASGCLLDFGEKLPAFLEGFEPAGTLPYLPDVTRLEWAFHSSYHAADRLPLPPAALAAVPPERHGRLRLGLHPSARLLASDWPVLRIFELNQPDCRDESTLDLRREGSCRVLAVRPELEVALHALEPGEFAFLAALEREADLATAYDAAAAIDPGFDLARTLLAGFERGAFAALDY